MSPAAYRIFKSPMKTFLKRRDLDSVSFSSAPPSPSPPPSSSARKVLADEESDRGLCSEQLFGGGGDVTPRRPGGAGGGGGLGLCKTTVCSRVESDKHKPEGNFLIDLGQQGRQNAITFCSVYLIKLIPSEVGVIL